MSQVLQAGDERTPDARAQDAEEEADKYDGLTKTEAKFQDILDKLGIDINLGKGS